MIVRPVTRITQAPAMIATLESASPRLWMNTARRFRSLCSPNKPQEIPPFTTSAMMPTTSMAPEATGSGRTIRW